MYISYYIDDFLVFSFFFFPTEFLWVTYGSSFAPLKLPGRRHGVVVAPVDKSTTQSEYVLNV